MPGQPPVSLIIPCCNEESCVESVMREFRGAAERIGLPLEMIVVDDGSTDGTAAVLAASRVPDKIITHRVNRGYGAALKNGIRAATHELVAIIDADGQHSPEDMVALIDAAATHDMVIGARRRAASPFWRRPGKLLLKWICELLVGRRIPDLNSGFRVMRRSEALRLMGLCSDQFSFSTSVTLAFLSDRLAVDFVPISVRARQGGRSRVTLGTGFSTFMLILRTIGTFEPLKIFMPPTLVLFVVGMYLLIDGLLDRNVGDVAILCLLTSSMLFCFGLLADQIALLRRGTGRV